jgi:hypothetical protein
MEISYEFKNPLKDEVAPEGRNLARGILEGYWVSPNRGPPDSDNDYDTEEEVKTWERKCM